MAFVRHTWQKPKIGLSTMFKCPLINDDCEHASSPHYCKGTFCLATYYTPKAVVELSGCPQGKGNG